MQYHNFIIKKIEYCGKVMRSFFVSDLRYRQSKYSREFNRVASIIMPASLNEKINHRMIYDHNPDFTLLADKVKVRDYVRDKIGEHYLVPLLGVYEKFDDIDIKLLPQKFVIKCTHDSGSAIICTNKNHFNFSKAKKKIEFCLRRNMYYATREWHYKNIKPAVICEKYIDLFLEKDKSVTPEIFRLHCFSGQVQFVEVDITDENKKEFVNVYNCSWQLLPFTVGYPTTDYPLEKPVKFAKLIALAEKLAEDIDYCRVDMYATDDEIYFSEITLAPCNGRIKIKPLSWDFRLGELWESAKDKSAEDKIVRFFGGRL